MWLGAGCGAPVPGVQYGRAPVAEILKELRRRHGRNEQHLHGDHELPVAVRPDLRLRLDNIVTLCNRCHSQKTWAESRYA